MGSKSGTGDGARRITDTHVIPPHSPCGPTTIRGKRSNSSCKNWRTSEEPSVPRSRTQGFGFRFSSVGRGCPCLPQEHASDDLAQTRRELHSHLGKTCQVVC